jgi:hypothetical protein
VCTAQRLLAKCFDGDSSRQLSAISYQLSAISW